MFINEIFFSIQGESTYSGLPCVFIRLAGCNLGCAWCDTPDARNDKNATELTISEVTEKALAYKCHLIEITGGEPLLQVGTAELAKELLNAGATVLLETNGSVELTGLDSRIKKIVDVKCPSSGSVDSFIMDNLDHIEEGDEVKFVITGKSDYEFAKDFCAAHIKGTGPEVLFSPATGMLPPGTLASWILEDRLNVRLHLQLHKEIEKLK